MNTRLDHRDPLVFDTRELGRRPGAMKKVSRSVPAPKDLGVAEVIGVPEGATVALELRLESVMEGVLVTGTAHAPVTGECVRCLEPVEWELDAEFQEMFSYPDADTRTARRDEAGDDAEDEDTLELEDDLFDLESVLRDAVVLALPLQPVCRDDCPGLCSTCGAPLADDPDHHHEVTDIRWAALKDLNQNGAGDGSDDDQEK
ncbi:YceD family protein [Streptomyces sp. V4-01]|uniref:YceD family protein n=1 Tax=Actinacidiphila polyblastidii TaxID=3110430 RepID=A0ABU7P4X4_9ACTN|nr:YceD family protein [Streptomyces sp. V4-01]